MPAIAIVMERKKHGRLKMLEDSLAAQLADMKGDLSDKNFKEILKSARWLAVSCIVCRQYRKSVCGLYTSSKWVISAAVPWLLWQQ